MLKHGRAGQAFACVCQPPSGGCVLKQHKYNYHQLAGCQPPSGGCVLKPVIAMPVMAVTAQPPSGGCVLKPECSPSEQMADGPAAFRRLCVETYEHVCDLAVRIQPPSGGCVLKHGAALIKKNPAFQPPSGGCVLKPLDTFPLPRTSASRLQAAVC